MIQIYKVLVQMIVDFITGTGVVTSIYRKEAEGYDKILEISRTQRHAESMAKAKAVMDELKAPSKATK